MSVAEHISSNEKLKLAGNPHPCSRFGIWQTKPPDPAECRQKTPLVHLPREISDSMILVTADSIISSHQKSRQKNSTRERRVEKCTNKKERVDSQVQMLGTARGKWQAMPRLSPRRLGADIWSSAMFTLTEIPRPWDALTQRCMNHNILTSHQLTISPLVG